MPANQFDIGERIEATGGSFYFGRFQLKVEQNVPRLFADGNAIALSTAESTILRVLLEKCGEFVKTEELLKSIAPASIASENLVHGAVRGLRRTLNDADLIKNERSKGYCFTGVVRRDEDRPPVSEATTAIPNRAGRPQAVESRDPFVVVALLVTAPVVLLPFGLVLFGGNWDSLPRQLGFIQALMILVAIAYDFYFAGAPPSRPATNETDRALLAVAQLRRFWRLLLASWCCLYITLPFSQWLAPASANATSWQWQALQVTTTLLNNCSALMLALGYLVLNRPTVVRVANREIDKIPLRSGLLLVAAIALLEALLLASSGRFARADLTADILFAFDLVSGVAGGIAMALFISRLDSRLLGTKGLLPIIPAVLYFYVVIQPFYPFINRTAPNRLGVSQHFDLWIIQLAFMLKAVMYIYVTELFRTERFLFYMIHARRIYENVESEWNAFRRR